MSSIWDTYKYGKENPFYVEPVQKAFYHPSPHRRLDSSLKQASPGSNYYVKDSKYDKGDDIFDAGGAGEGGIYHMVRVGELGLSVDGESVSFNESWPQSERPSTISIPETDNTMPSLTNQRGKNFKDSAGLSFEEDMKSNSNKTGNYENNKLESTLSKYIDRFRNAQPMSREDRLKKKLTEPDDFWWMRSPTSQIYGSDDGREKIDSRQIHQKLQKRGNCLHLEHKDREASTDDGANGLHEEMTSMKMQGSVQSFGSSHPVVSTIGLGSDSDSAVTFTEEPSRPSFIRDRELRSRMLPGSVRPEDDILYRYRLRRKREQAKDEMLRRRTDASDVMSHTMRKPQTCSVVPECETRREEPWRQESLSSQQPIISSQSAEVKKDAEIQTLDNLGHPPFSYVPIACPHVALPGFIPTVNPHCHLSCDILASTSSHNHGNKASEDKSTLISSDNVKNAGDKSAENERNLDKFILSTMRDPPTGEQCAEQEDRRQVTSNRNFNFRRSTRHKKVSADEVSKDNTESLPPIGKRQNKVATKQELSDTELWHTTDFEGEAPLESEKDIGKDHKYLRNDLESKEISSIKTTYKNSSGSQVSREKMVGHSKTAVSDSREPVPMKNISRAKKEKIQNPKNHSSPTLIRKAVDQAISDQLMTSVSSIENFGLSDFEFSQSLDVEVSDVEEQPVHDTSIPRDERPATAPCVDAESVIFSDGEEFKDDDILCNLRQRRQFCIQRLNELDQILLKSEES